MLTIVGSNASFLERFFLPNEKFLMKQNIFSQDIYRRSYAEYVRNIQRSRVEVDSDVIGSSVAERLIQAFNALDDDMSAEALVASDSGEKNMKTVREHET